MALYAFDGTWNKDEVADDEDTNVVRFREIYAGADFEYLTGVGTRFGALGQIVGGLFGAGGRSRIEEMYESLCENWTKGDQDIDIIGFSRGAALAVHFTNEIAKRGIEGTDAKPRIRFLGVWDIVGSFGLSFDTVISFQDVNLGWDIEEVADIVDHCFHAMALDERRETFNITRLDKGHNQTNVEEVWFRGVHSDVGGGNTNVARSNIALHWMLDKARHCGVPLNEVRAAEAKYNTMDPAAPISENKDIARDPRREELPGDQYHPTAEPRRLMVDESHECTVHAAMRYNWSGVELERAAEYQISVPEGDVWDDGKIECGANGWETEDLPWIKEKIGGLFEGRRRQPDANWFALIGAYSDEESNLFTIGKDTTFVASETADLYLFANDLKSKYDNNDGSLQVTIKRLR